MPTNIAFQKLVSLDDQVRERKPELPMKEEVQSTWSGVGFSLNGCYYVSPIHEVAEILEIPRYTQVPGVGRWVKGVANVRGKLIPVLDLMQFFFGSVSKVQTKRHRLFILESGELYTGIIVDEVIGMQHFLLDTFLPQVRVLDQLLRPFVTGGYVDDGRIWPVFSPLRLFDDPKFMKLESVDPYLHA